MSDHDIDSDCLELFEQSVGRRFRIKGTPLIDEIVGVYWKFMMVKGKLYGDFAVSLCEMTNSDETSTSN